MRRAGFTLIEVVVALFIAAVMFSIGYRALNQAGQEIARHEASGTDLVLGLGVEYSFSPRWTLGAHWTRYDIDGETVDLAGLALRFGFGGSR